MVLSIVVILLVGVVAYFNFAQGFFSATLSAFAAVLAAVLAVGYLETVLGFVHGSMADVSSAMVLCLLFVVAYVILRMILDKAVPGNVRTPATVNAVGAGLMGVVAGTFCVGIFVIALQMLPFGPTISFLGYTRYKLLPGHDVVLLASGNGRNEDAKIGPQMAESTLDPAKQESTLFVPVDSAVLATVDHLSDGGSLSGTRTLGSVHPDWLLELYGERLGQQTGNRRSALVRPGSDPVSVDAVYRPTSLATYDVFGPIDKRDPETNQLRPPGYKNPYEAGLKATRDMIPLVVRVKVAASATDDPDHLFRFSPGAVRLTLRPTLPDGAFGRGTDYYPVGILDNGKVVVVDRVDDFLFVNLSNGDAGFDAVFYVPADTLEKGKGNSAAVVAGTFLTVKRLATVDLSGVTAADVVPADPKFAVMRTDLLHAQLPPAALPPETATPH